jgi:hypothetical protein
MSLKWSLAKFLERITGNIDVVVITTKLALPTCHSYEHDVLYPNLQRKRKE